MYHKNIIQYRNRLPFRLAIFSFLQSFILLLTLTTISSCKKLVDVGPPGNIVTESNIFNTDPTAIAVLTGIYTRMNGVNYNGSAGIPNLTYWAGLSADEFSLWNGADQTPQSYFKNNLQASVAGSEFWSNTYPIIYSCNAAIEGLDNSKSLTPEVKKQLLGESKFLRAYFYFYLVNLYGDVPLVITTDYKANSILPRASKSIIYNQIVQDLKDAQALLSDKYIQADGKTPYPVSSSERVRPNKGAATALLARVYLYYGDLIHDKSYYTLADQQASTVIDNKGFYSLVNLNDVFLKNSQEAIWQLQPVGVAEGNNCPDAAFFNLSYSNVQAGLGSSHPVYLSNSLVNSFELGDQRKINWISSYTDATGTYYYAYKYKVAVSGNSYVTPVEYTMLLRLGEQYLIRAEARAQLNNISGALSDLNIIRNRAFPAGNIITVNDQQTLLADIRKERRVELFCELGHRWLDLKRTELVDIVMSKETPIKANGAIWDSNQKWYPLPITDLARDPYLKQNSGY